MKGAGRSQHADERELSFLLVDAGRKLNDAYDQQMKPLGLSRAKWRVIAYVSRTPGISQTELAQSIECSRMAITSLLDRMQSQGLIERQVAEGDRRVRAVFLTEDGRAVVRRMNRIAAAVLDDIFAGTSRRDRSQLKRLLNTIKVNATAIAERNGSG